MERNRKTFSKCGLFCDYTHTHTYYLHCSRQGAGISYTKRMYSFKVLNTMKKGFQCPLGCLGMF